MSLDTITIRITNEAELDADSADINVVVEGSSVFSGAEAFKKAKELRALIESLKEAGVEEDRVKLRSVEINSQSFALLKTSSAKYTVSIKKVEVERLPAALGTIAASQGAKLSRLKWNYSRLKETRGRLRREALAEALIQARSDAEILGVEVLGIHQVTEETRGRDYNPEYITGNNIDCLMLGDSDAEQEIGLHLGNSTTVTFDLRAEFRVGPISNVERSDATDPVPDEEPPSASK